MSAIEMWSAAANHGFYGQTVLCVFTAWTREDAVRGVLKKVSNCLQQVHKERLDGEVEGIVAFLQTHYQWNGGDSDGESVNEDYLHVVIACDNLELSLKHISKKKRKER